MNSFVNLAVMLTFLLSLAPHKSLAVGSSNVSRYPLAVRGNETAEQGSKPDKDAVDHGPPTDKRFDNARFTYYADGLGACGQFNGPGDFVSTELFSTFLLCTCSLVFLAVRL